MKINPCKCGGEADTSEAGTPFTRDGLFRVVCLDLKCGIEGPVRVGETRAIKAWNSANPPRDPREGKDL